MSQTEYFWTHLTKRKFNTTTKRWTWNHHKPQRVTFLTYFDRTSDTNSSMTSSQLPSSRSFITSIITSLATEASHNRPEAQEPQSHNPLKNASQQTKSLLLTLHVLFPNELLPALDVLDRNLVTRTRVRSPASSRPQRTGTEVFLVRSAQQPSSHHSRHEGRFTNPMSTHYEVRTEAWNCSCPAFAFSAFPVDDSADSTAAFQRVPMVRQVGESEEQKWSFGGLSLDGHAGAVAVCKHLLACVLVEHCPGLFGSALEVRDVSKEEFAGWCAGWGG